jgi:adenine-specific DNA glycosylase
VRTVSYAVVVALNPAGELFMIRRSPEGLLGGLWEFPSVEIGVEDSTRLGQSLCLGDSLRERCRVRLEDLGVRLPSRKGPVNVLPAVRHIFTHFKAVYRPILLVGARSGETEGIRANGAVAEPENELNRERRWVSPKQVEQLPLPVAQLKILELATDAIGV